MSREDLNQLLDALIPFAQKLLSQQGQFLPFAAAINAAGGIRFLGGQAGGDNASPKEIQDHLLGELQQGARKGAFRAAGLCSDMHVRRGEDAATSVIGISLEHSDGTSIDVFLPYTWHGDGRVEYGERFASARELCIFLPSTP